MKLRWIGPLLQAPAVQNFAPRWLYHYLYHGSKAPDPFAPILLMECRKGPMRSSTTTNGLLLGTCDYLPGFMSALPDVTIAPDSAPEKLGLQRLKAIDAFIYDNGTKLVRRRSPDEMSVSPRLLRLFFQALDRQDILLDLFFIRKCIPALGEPEGDDPGNLDLTPFVKNAWDATAPSELTFGPWIPHNHAIKLSFTLFRPSALPSTLESLLAPADTSLGEKRMVPRHTPPSPCTILTTFYDTYSLSEPKLPPMPHRDQLSRAFSFPMPGQMADLANYLVHILQLPLFLTVSP